MMLKTGGVPEEKSFDLLNVPRDNPYVVVLIEIVAQ